MVTLHDLICCHRNGLLGNIVDRGKPAFSHLLHFATVIQIYNDIGVFGLKVSGWVIESDMRVFADTDQAHINGCLTRRRVSSGMEAGFPSTK